jgi:Histidine kinase-, DNA gyrase B-, and HSP90-like ATPase
MGWHSPAPSLEGKPQMSQYSYLRSGELVARLGEAIAARRVAVVMGPRRAGKLSLLRRACANFELRLRRARCEAVAIGLTRFSTQPEPTVGPIIRANDEPIECVEEIDPEPGAILRWAKRQATCGPATLVIANIDSAGQSPRALFDALIRARQTGPPFGVIVSAEIDLIASLEEPSAKSGEGAAIGFVLQGLDLNDFRTTYAELDRAADGRLATRSSPEALYAETGGNVFLLYQDWVEALLSAPVNAHGSLDSATIVEESRVGLRRMMARDVARYLDRRVVTDREARVDLERLLERDSPYTYVNEPGPLELAGIVERSEAEGRIRFASPRMRRIVEAHFNPRRIATCWAMAGDWEVAMRKLQDLSPADRVRPAAEAEVAEAERIVALYCGEFAAAESVEDLRRKFVNGCHFLLGFPVVDFYRGRAELPTDEDKAGDTLVQRRAGAGIRVAWELEIPVVAQGVSVLPSEHPPNVLEPMIGRVCEDDNALAIAYYEGGRGKDLRLVRVRDVDDRLIGGLDRKALLVRLMQAFVASVRTVTADERMRTRIRRRDGHTNLINEVYARLGTPGYDRARMLRTVARRLRKIGKYRRVILSAVDPSSNRLRAEVEILDNDECREYVTKCINEWRLDELTDIQQLVVRFNKPQVIADSITHPLTNRKAVLRGDIKAGAVVPVGPQSRRGDERADRVVGTIHIEPKCRRIPTPDEIEDLVAFGHQLAPALKLFDGTRLLFEGLDRIGDAILIVDHSDRIAYLNTVAAETIRKRRGAETSVNSEIRPGWQRTPRSLPISSWEFQEPARSFFDTIKRALSLKCTIGLGLPARMEGGALPEHFGVAQMIPPPRSKQPRRLSPHFSPPIATVARLKDHQFLSRIVEDIRKAQENRAADQIIDQAFHSLGKLFENGWGRLYRNKRIDGVDRLVACSAFGNNPPDLTSRIERGEVILNARSPATLATYKAIDDRCPVAFVLRGSAKGSGDEYEWNDAGLQLVMVNRHDCPVGMEKNDGDSWIDFPLVAVDVTFGKITLDCHKNFPPEDFYFLQMFSAIVADLLRLSRLWEQGVDYAARMAMAQTAHSLKTRIAPLHTLLECYRDVESRNPEIRELNEQFSEECDWFTRTFEKAPTLLTPALSDRLKRAPVDLGEQFRAVLGAQAGPHQWSVEPDGTRVNAMVDPHLFQLAISELVANSLHAIRMKQDQGRICVKLASNSNDVIITVSDNGPGIPQANKSRVFDDFFSRWDGLAVSSGLGLGFLRRVVRAHGGEVEEVGTHGIGARFVLRIPHFPLPLN